MAVFGVSIFPTKEKLRRKLKKKEKYIKDQHIKQIYKKKKLFILCRKYFMKSIRFLMSELLKYTKIKCHSIENLEVIQLEILLK